MVKRIKAEVLSVMEYV